MSLSVRLVDEWTISVIAFENSESMPGLRRCKPSLARPDGRAVPLVIIRVPGEQLVLTTSAGERIVIEAEPAPTKGDGAVRIVIDAPRTVQVLRSELEGRPRG